MKIYHNFLFLGFPRALRKNVGNPNFGENCLVILPDWELIFCLVHFELPLLSGRNMNKVAEPV